MLWGKAIKVHMLYHLLPKLLFTLVISTSLFSCTQSNTNKNAIYYQFQAIHAYQSKDYGAFLYNLKEANKLAPNNPQIMYGLARAYALNKNKKASIEYLQKVIQVGYHPNIKQTEDFSYLRNTAAFKTIQKIIKQIKTPINNSKIAFKIPEKDLVPEGIAYDPVEETFYIGSIYKCKIISIDKEKTIKNFTSEKQDGLLSIAGMKVDAKKRILWVNSSEFYRMKGFDKNNAGYTCVFKYNIDNRKLIKKYILDEKPTLHLFNDLVINSRGDIFITDSSFGAVYTISHQSDDLKLFIKPNRFTYPNGIAISQDERYLFVTHVEGTSVIDINTKSYFVLPHPKNLAITGIEGLYFYKNTLIAIQDDNWHGRVIQLSLKKSSYKADHFKDNKIYSIQNAKIIEAGNHLFSHPTTGVIVHDFFYYIANSQQSKFRNDGVIFPSDKLNDILVFRVKL